MHVAAIYSGQSTDRSPWKVYLKTLWVEIADKTFVFRVALPKEVLADHKQMDKLKTLVFDHWEGFPRSEAIESLELGIAENVPARLGGTSDANLRKPPARPNNIRLAALDDDE